MGENDLVVARRHFHNGLGGELFLAAGLQQEIGQLGTKLALTGFLTETTRVLSGMQLFIGFHG